VSGGEASAPARVNTSWGASGALARRAFRDARTRTIAFAYLFALYAYIQPAGYRHAYPTLADRIGFAHSFAGNDALRLFYGYPYDVVTIGGYSAWRVGGTLAIAAAIYGVLAAVRALRAEEDAGRAELVLAGCVGRGAAFLSSLAAIAAGVAVLWVAELVGFLVGGLPLGESAYMALETASVAPVFVGIGALAGQLAPTRRLALELGTVAVGVLLLLRVVADTSGGAAWLRWVTPLGWAEELRPFAGPQPLALLPTLLASAFLLALAARLATRRDVGTGLLRARDSAVPNRRLLGSPVAQALRGERTSLIVWSSGVGVFALVLGIVSASISSAGITKSIREELARLGSGSIVTPAGYLSFVFVFFVLAVSLFACAQVSAARREEADQHLETLLALPVGRHRWLAGRLLLASAAAAFIALTAGLLSWAGAASQGVDISLARMLEAGANCLPAALLFLGVAAFAYALVPRAGAPIAYGLVIATFLWQLVGSLLGVPRWLVDLTPFAHIGLVPTQPFRAGSAAIMLGLGALCAAGALWAFRRRDLTGV
jgi:polyether ionophore transport system permease protein